MTLYTALGKYELKPTHNGKKLPHITVGGREFELDMWEMILWSSLVWNIYTFDEISREFYRKEREAHILGDCNCETYLDRMERKGLIACGRGVTAEDALRDLLGRLCVVPATANLATKIAAFLRLTFAKGVPFEITRRIFASACFTDSERELMRLAKQHALTVGELQAICESSDAFAYVVNLYLNKHIIFNLK